MKFFQCVISSIFHKSQNLLPLKTFARDLSCIISRHNHNNTCSLHKHSASLYYNINRFHTVQGLQHDQDLSVSQSKKRLQRKKILKLESDIKEGTWSAVAYSSAKQYKIEDLALALKSVGGYKFLPLPEDAGNVLHVSAENEVKKSPHIYFFSEGSVVFWNVPESEREKILNFLKPFERNPYDALIVRNEKEDLDYTYSENDTSFFDGRIVLNSNANSDLYTYTFSNSLAHSVKLGVLEAALERFCDSIEWVTERMENGEKINMSRNEISQKRGQLFVLRHVINLSSDLLDTPDFYWDRKDLEILYKNTCNYLDIEKRTKTMNERLSYCSELVDLLGHTVNDQHHVRLEWMIIILIMVEVFFESVHFVERLIV